MWRGLCRRRAAAAAGRAEPAVAHTALARPQVALKACFEDMQAAEDYILANRKAMGLSVTILRATVLKTSSFVKDYTDPVKTYKLVPVSDTAAKLSFFVEMQARDAAWATPIPPPLCSHPLGVLHSRSARPSSTSRRRESTRTRR